MKKAVLVGGVVVWVGYRAAKWLDRTRQDFIYTMGSFDELIPNPKGGTK